jgi:hypothetical protein
MGSINHPLVLAVAVAMTAVLWLRRRQLGQRDALLALALLLLVRCVLDTWDVVYYTLPFLLALLAWEVSAPTTRVPLLALSSTVLVWVSFHWLPWHASPDAQAGFFLAWSVPLVAWLGARVYWPRRAALRRRSGEDIQAGAQEATVSALGRLVRTS